MLRRKTVGLMVLVVIDVMMAQPRVPMVSVDSDITMVPHLALTDLAAIVTVMEVLPGPTVSAGSVIAMEPQAGLTASVVFEIAMARIAVQMASVDSGVTKAPNAPAPLKATLGIKDYQHEEIDFTNSACDSAY